MDAHTRIGVDVDGVLANFNQAFVDRIREMFGVVVPLPPLTWEYHKEHINEEQNRELWRDLALDDEFWTNLEPLPGNALDQLANYPEVHFITTRPGGKAARTRTMTWLRRQGIVMPSVFVSENKGKTARNLELEHIFDDKPENLFSVAEEYPSCRRHLITAPYNEWAHKDKRIDRIHLNMEAGLETI